MILKLFGIAFGTISTAVFIMWFVFTSLNLIIRALGLMDDYLSKKENNFRVKHNIKDPCNNCTGCDYL